MDYWQVINASQVTYIVYLESDFDVINVSLILISCLKNRKNQKDSINVEFTFQ